MNTPIQLRCWSCQTFKTHQRINSFKMLINWQVEDRQVKIHTCTTDSDKCWIQIQTGNTLRDTHRTDTHKSFLCTYLHAVHGTKSLWKLAARCCNTHTHTPLRQVFSSVVRMDSKSLRGRAEHPVWVIIACSHPSSSSSFYFRFWKDRCQNSDSFEWNVVEKQFK